MVDENVTIQVDSSEIDTTVAKLEAALDKKKEVDDVKDSAEVAKGDVEEVTMSAAKANEEVADLKAEAELAKKSVDEVSAESENIKGTNILARRTVAQIPGIREGYHLLMLIRTMLRISPEIAVILGLWMAGRTIMDWLASGEREREEYRKLVMGVRGFTTRSQYDAWKAEDDRRTLESFRSGVIL